MFVCFSVGRKVWNLKSLLSRVCYREIVSYQNHFILYKLVLYVLTPWYVVILYQLILS